jgi:hypothetical protein
LVYDIKTNAYDSYLNDTVVNGRAPPVNGGPSSFSVASFSFSTDPSSTIVPRNVTVLSDGTPAVGQYILGAAADSSINPGNGTANYNWTAQATDTGGAFNSNGANGGLGFAHFDLYVGVLHTQSIPFDSPMVMFTCDRQPPPPASLASVFTTLCPSATNQGILQPGQASVRGQTINHQRLAGDLRPVRATKARYPGVNLDRYWYETLLKGLKE